MFGIFSLLILALTTACSAPSARLSFNVHPIKQSDGLTWYDATGNGKPSFAVSLDSFGRIDKLYYSDNEDAKPDRIYRLSDYADHDVPHVFLFLDSIPYDWVADSYAKGHLRWFAPPVKVIPPFPSLTEICFTDVLRAPPLDGMIDQSYDPRTRRQRGSLWERVWGYSQPWERRLDYHASFWEYGLSYLDPRPWYAGELERARAVIDNSPYNVTLVYIGSASSMVCKYGRDGIRETLEGAEQFCLQLLYERHGAVKISMMADHGHNLLRSINVPIGQYLRDAGLNPSDTIVGKDDVVVEVNGLVTYAAVQTTQPRRVADILARRPELQLVMYMDGGRVIVRDAAGSAAVECVRGKVCYKPIDRDVLGYEPVLAELAKQGKVDANGCISDDDWLAATADHEWPDAPRRVWDAFHRTAVFPPRVMFTTKDGYCAGLDAYEKYIDMESTHGGLNQVNSATFVMTMMDGRVSAPMRSRDVLEHLEPGFTPIVREK